jgi:acyl-CoA synthetase (NDP forming)
MPALSQPQAFDMLKKEKLPICRTVFAKDSKEAKKLFKKMKKPIALKIDSPQIIHKSDFGGIKTNIQKEKELNDAISFMLKSAKKAKLKDEKGKPVKAKVNGFVLQEQKKGIEVIIGTKKDSQFGQVIVFGLGGIFVEVIKDSSMAICPITIQQANEMIDGIKGKKLLEGYRGGIIADKKKLSDLLVSTSRFVSRHPEIIEMDFNPVIVTEKDAVIVDARIIIEDNK